MFCSKCKIISLHLPNFDCFVCENGHFLCRICHDDMQPYCVLCGAIIIREAEVRLEGVPKAVFKERKGPDRASEVESDRLGSLTTSEEWFRQHPKHSDRDVPIECKEMHWDMKCSQVPVGDNAFIDIQNEAMHNVGDSNYESKNQFFEECKATHIKVKSSKSSCHFNTSSKDSCISFPNVPQQDPKELYKKALKGEIKFDPKIDYHQRLATVKNIKEFYKRPELSRESSSNIDFKNHPVGVFTSTALPDPIIRAGPEHINNNKNQKANNIEINQLGLKEDNYDIHINTMMDMLIEPCLNYISFTAQHEHVSPHFKSSEDNRRCLYAEVKNVNKLHSEGYSNFGKQRSQQSNSFKTITNNSNIPGDSSTYNQRNTILEYTNQESEKPLNKEIAPVENLDEIKYEANTQKSKTDIRDKVVHNLYMNSNETTIAPKLVQSKSEPSLNLSTAQSNISGDEADFRKFPTPPLSSASQEKQYHSIGVSTESYPKLNPDLAVLSVNLSSYSQPCEGKLHTLPTFKRRSHCELEKRASGKDQLPKISEHSKYSEGPFIQSIDENGFEESDANMKSTAQFPQESVINGNEAENVVQSVKYPEVISNDLKSNELPDKLVPDEEKRHASKGNVSNAITLKDFKEKFPDLSVKQIKDIILNLPNECDENNCQIINSSSKAPALKRCEAPEKKSIATSRKTIAWRAFYRPVSKKDLMAEPAPQFKPISIEVNDKALLKDDSPGVRLASDLNIPRSPVTCPLTSCKKLIFVSEFTKHIKVDHAKLPIETLSPGKCKNLVLDLKVVHHGINKCHILYLVTDKIRDLGSREYKDFLPVLLMSTKVSLEEVLGPKRARMHKREFYLMIWLTGLNAKKMPIYYSLTAWSRFVEFPRCSIVHSGQLYSIRDDQDSKTIMKTGQALILSPEQCCKLSCRGRKMIELQVIVH